MINHYDFSTAHRIVWHRLTVFEPYRSDDGDLVAYDGDGEEFNRFPLDTFHPYEVCLTTVHLLGEDQGFIVQTSKDTDELHELVREWCGKFIGRKDIDFL